MCGIAGAISFIEDMRDDMKTYENMQKSMIRRGPDQRGMVISREAALIHTRLAVIDIEGGRQPMSFGDYTIVYNGELYNTDDIRRELGSDFAFTTHSDTEVVLKAFIRWGEDCVEKLNGISPSLSTTALRGEPLLPATGSVSSRCSTFRTKAS